MKPRRYLLLLPIIVLLAMNAHGQSEKTPATDQSDSDNWNLPFKTTGGKQLWTDVRHLAGWRIQTNKVTGHHRLIDQSDVRRAWGSLASCEKKLASQADSDQLKPVTGKLVVLVHGLNRSHKSMGLLHKHLEESGYATINFQYASGRASITDHANALKTVIDNSAKDATEISFVAHSLGNIVIRRYLKLVRDDNIDSREGDPRFHRMVMLAPPNRGSRMARLFGKNIIFKTVTGGSGQELGKPWNEFEKLLAVPRFEFGVIAGGMDESSKIKNPLLPVPNDLVVSVEETKLSGARDMVVRPFKHTFIMQQEETLKMSSRFLDDGYFVSDKDRKPIP